MRKFNLKYLLSLVLLLTVVFVFAQSDSSSTSDSGRSVGQFIKELLIAILFFGGSLFVIGHMIYLIYTSKKRFSGVYDVNFFRNLRKEKGKSSESTPEETQQAYAELNKVFYCWSNVMQDEEGNEFRKPKKMKEIEESSKALQAVIDLAPTDSGVIENINSYIGVIRTNEERKFDGSWKLIILGLVIAIIFALIGKAESNYIMAFLKWGSIFWVPVAIYYISSLTPRFLIEKRQNRGGGKVTTGLVAAAFAILGSGRSYKTYYTDGSSTEDHSEHGIALFIGFVLLFFIALTIIFWAVLNYLRNYVLYF